MSAAAFNRTVSHDDAKRLDEILLPFQQATQFVAANYKKLLQDYPEQWIAVTGSRVLAASTRRDLIRQALKKSNTDRNKVYVTFLTRKKQTLIL